ncbi:ImmA/IrrE family metallo-endopeptidase [Pseudomonas sp. B21-019]|uniref:ImmA/IrrE family metallo-endopeptidase n=1 Tax=Pseudomonas sp. B21-019 TaxID=2895475 RepID=UPI002160A74B|nr:ImmA/IrrE family metallo-endopeptidase [Pseudomonas sp. B21-019]UVM33409.1 ImmA/IrrE family metallo-endopeptidase [Pseudomonas sp. B21-019]
MYPEEKMAARVLKRKGLTPPYNLIDLANSYGELRYRSFPFKADGITVGIGEQARPTIYINSDCPETRQRFTLAHEVGHIIIPWHTGTVVSHLEPGSDDDEYWLMEQQANRFAAELLMPTEWLKQIYAESASVEKFFRRVLLDTGASKEAVFYKIFKDLDAPVACARLDEVFGTISQLKRTRFAPHDDKSTLPGEIYNDIDHEFEEFLIDGKAFCAWTLKGKEILELDPRTWRELLKQMLDDTNLQSKLGSINSIMSAAFDKSKHLAETDICGGVIRSFRSRDGLPGLKEHELFEQYVIKRVKELKLRSQKGR